MNCGFLEKQKLRRLEVHILMLTRKNNDTFVEIRIKRDSFATKKIDFCGGFVSGLSGETLKRF